MSTLSPASVLNFGGIARRCFLVELGTAILTILFVVSSGLAFEQAGAGEKLRELKSQEQGEVVLKKNGNEKQVTHGAYGHILTNTGAWSPDGAFIYYDVRSDATGASFDGTRIERVNVSSGEVQTVYESTSGACCGVVTCSPVENKIVFIHGPEQPTPEWQYAGHHRRGVVVTDDDASTAATLDARDLTPPFTPGALRGGSHVHVFSGDGQWVSFTYQDHVLAESDLPADKREEDQRNVGVSVPCGPVHVGKDHPRNHDGTHCTVLVTKTVDNPQPGSDEISKAYSDAWVGTNGYLRSDGTRQSRAVAFLGDVVTEAGETIPEVFIVDLPEQIDLLDTDTLIQGSETLRPRPPRGVVQRRLTFTAERKHPGVQGTRHWVRSSPDGSQIAFLMRDEQGISQLWTVSPNGGPPRQVSSHPWDIASAFTWSSDGRWIAHVMDNSIFVTEVQTGKAVRLTERFEEEHAPRAQACVFSPDGQAIAYVRPVRDEGTGKDFNQVFATSLKSLSE